jgi:hypothetical protein
LAIYGRATAPAAITPKDPSITERLVGWSMVASFLLVPRWPRSRCEI